MHDDRKETAPSANDNSTHVEAFDACYGTESDYAGGIEAWKQQQDQDLKAALRAPGIVRDPKGGIVPRNAGAYADIERQTRELHRHGLPLAAATQQALDEQPNVLHPEEPSNPTKGNYLGESVISLMSKRVKRGGGGDSTGTAKALKSLRSEGCHACGLHNAEDVAVCQRCGAELPIAVGKKRGRKAKFAGRHERVRARISQPAKSAIKKANLSESDALEIVGIALSTGRTFEAVLVEHREALQQRGDVA